MITVTISLANQRDGLLQSMSRPIGLHPLLTGYYHVNSLRNLLLLPVQIVIHFY